MVTTDDSRCNMDLYCTSGGCDNTDVWDGVYSTSASGQYATDCDPDHCCCLDVLLAVYQDHSTVLFSFHAASSRRYGCHASRIGSSCDLRDGNTCTRRNVAASKSGGSVTVTDSSDSRCNMNLRCTSGGCNDTRVWTGLYRTRNSRYYDDTNIWLDRSTSGSKVPTVSLVYLLVTTVSGLLM